MSFRFIVRLFLLLLVSLSASGQGKPCSGEFKGYVRAPDLNDEGQSVVREDIFRVREWSLQEQWDQILVPSSALEKAHLGREGLAAHFEVRFQSSSGKKAVFKPVGKPSKLNWSGLILKNHFQIETLQLQKEFSSLAPDARSLLIVIRDETQEICRKEIPVVIH